LTKNPKKSPKNQKIYKKSQKIKKIPENPKFFPFKDLNLRTPKSGVVNPSYSFEKFEILKWGKEVRRGKEATRVIMTTRMTQCKFNLS